MLSSHCLILLVLFEYTLEKQLQGISKSKLKGLEKRDLKVVVSFVNVGLNSGFLSLLTGNAGGSRLVATCGGDSICLIDCEMGMVMKKYKVPGEVCSIYSD